VSSLDWAVLCSTLTTIVGYGVWRTRGARDMSRYLRGGNQESWLTIGLSVMATQASAVTFLSMPGQAYQDGMRFIQFYFGLPLATIVISVVFIPRYFQARVFTAYEFLEARFDRKTRQLTAFLFLLQRGLSAGITIYAPAIILSSVLGWPFRLTCLCIGTVVIVYTVIGGARAVSQTQKQQMVIMLAGMAAAFVVIVWRLPADVTFGKALRVAGALGKLDALDFSTNPNTRYTLWSGLLGGFFLSMAYFGTDQSQVQRYLGARSIGQSRVGLLFNGLLKIPMQALILLVGVMVFVFYQFHLPPVFFNQAELARAKQTMAAPKIRALEEKHAGAFLQQRNALDRFIHSTDAADLAASRQDLQRAAEQTTGVREEARQTIAAAVPDANTKDSDYIFLSFVMANLPRGMIGLLLVVIFCAAMSAVAGELSALASTTVVDFYRRSIRPQASDAHYVRAAQVFTAMWGALALAFAVFASLLDNLIQAVNILGSLFYGTILGIFLLAFFTRRPGANVVCVAAMLAEAIVIATFGATKISFLWYNVVGCLAVVALSMLLHRVTAAVGRT
jgi:SSS family transporter